MPKFRSEWTWVDPETASKMLQNNDDNRPIRQDWVENLANQILRGEYRPTHQGVAFDSEGRLVDGQHRLRAILLAEKGVWLLVTRGIPDKTILAIDRGRVRHDRDNIRIAFGRHINASDYTVARAMIDGMAGSRNGSARSRSVVGKEILDFIDKNAQAITFANVGSNKKGSPTALRATIARAYYHCDHDRLASFRDIVRKECTPQGEDDSSASRLMAYVAENISQFSTWDGWRGLIQFTTWSIVQFMNRRHIKRLDRMTEDPFPIPENYWPAGVSLNPTKKK